MYDQVDSRGVPISKGIPTAVRYAALIGVLAIFIVGGSVVWTSGYGHMWPANTVQRLDLTGGK